MKNIFVELSRIKYKVKLKLCYPTEEQAEADIFVVMVSYDGHVIEWAGTVTFDESLIGSQDCEGRVLMLRSRLGNLAVTR